MHPALPELETHGDERATLTSFLDYYRAVFARKMYGLDRAQLAASIPPSPLTLGGLWFHMAFVEDIWFEQRIAGRPLPEPWAGAPFGDDPDWEINTAHTRTPEELAATFSAAVDRSRATIEACASLDEATVVRARDSTTRNLRWVLVHMIEEYARHCGHADLLCEVVDGRVGD